MGVVKDGWELGSLPLGFHHSRSTWVHGERRPTFIPPPSLRQCMMGLLSDTYLNVWEGLLFQPISTPSSHFRNLHKYRTSWRCLRWKKKKYNCADRRGVSVVGCFVRPHFGCQSLLWPDWGKGLGTSRAGWALATSRRSHQPRLRPPHAPFCGQSLLHAIGDPLPARNFVQL